MKPSPSEKIQFPCREPRYPFSSIKKMLSATLLILIQPSFQAVKLYEKVMEKGKNLGLKNAGYRALEVGI